MNNQEYDQQKRECWEEYKRENLDGEVQWQPVSRYDVFIAAFDRAYALGKQTETITQEEIEKASVEFADREYEIGQVDWDALYKGHYHGMKNALSKKFGNSGLSDEEDTGISGWVARDDGERWHERELHLFTRNKPERRKLMGDWMGRPSMALDSNLFPDLTWKSDPEPVEIIIKRKKNG